MKYYTLREAAAIFGIKVRTMREWLRKGKIKAERSENDWYWKIPETEIMRLQEDDNKD